MAFPVQAMGGKLSDWDTAFKYIKSGGATSIGAPLEVMRMRKQLVEQIIMVTDAEENCAPFFHRVYKRYAEEMGIYPKVILVKVGKAVDTLEKKMNANRIEYDTYKDETGSRVVPTLVIFEHRDGKRWREWRFPPKDR